MRSALSYLFGVLFALLLLSIPVKEAYAQYDNYNLNPNTAEEVPQNLHNYTQTVLIETLSALSCQLTGVDPASQQTGCLGYDQKTGEIGFVKDGGGAIGVMGHLISSMYTPPTHTSDYFSYLGQNFGIAKNTYAQSPGMDGLKPLVKIWSAFRDIVYVFFVLIFVIIGVAIMLRIKIDPRTVMTIQNQIPKIIIGIILVTFSFAIAGLLIDFMYILIYFIWGFLSNIDGVNLSALAPNVFSGNTAVGLGTRIFWTDVAAPYNIAWDIRSIIMDALDIDTSSGGAFVPLVGWVFDPSQRDLFDLLINLVSMTAGTYMGIQAAQATPDIMIPGLNFLTDVLEAGAVGGVVGLATYEVTEISLRVFIPWILAYLVLFGAVFLALFRLWFTLLIAYVTILIEIVIAPFWILVGMLPGSKATFGTWFKDLLANLLGFVVAVTMFMLGKVFIDAFGTDASAFVPPLIGNPLNTNALGGLIGIGIVLATPGAVSLAKAAVKAPKLEAGSAIFGAVGGGVSILSGTGKEIGGTLKDSKEFTVTGLGPGGQAQYGQRRIGRAFLRRFGR